MSFRIAHLSDLHFGGENAEAMAAAATHIIEIGVDLVVLAGDLTVRGRSDEYAAAKAWADAIPGPKLVTPGNHDSPYGPERIFRPFRRFEQHFGPPDCVSWTSAAARVVAINSARGVQPRANWSKGQVSTAQIRRATAQFAVRPAGALAILVCHHPLVEMLGGPMSAEVWGGSRAARRLADSGVDLVLSGHVHAPFAMPFGFGDAHTFAVGSGTLSKRERGVPPGFNLIESSDDAHTVTALAWTGSHFESWRTWALPRRQTRRDSIGKS